MAVKKNDYPKTYRMNQVAVGIFGLAGILLLSQKIGDVDSLMLVVIVMLYMLLIGAPLFVLLAIKSSGEKFIEASKVLNYILLSFVVGGNVLSAIYMNGLKFSHVFSFFLLCAPAVINIRCLNNLNKNKVNS